jgi:hypothetical protein
MSLYTPQPRIDNTTIPEKEASKASMYTMGSQNNQAQVAKIRWKDGKLKRAIYRKSIRKCRVEIEERYAKNITASTP